MHHDCRMKGELKQLFLRHLQLQIGIHEEPIFKPDILMK